tara:strand:- start:4424 stop:4921 length:498 start_codon:yes stop_codon:yes gene_type:complete
MNILLIVIAIAVLVFTIWNIISLYQLKNQSKKKILNDPRYYELKYKFEFIVAVFSIIVAIAGLLGYNSLDNAKQEIKKELTEDLNPLDSTINILNEKMVKINGQIIEFESKQDNLINSLPISESQILSQKNEIQDIKNLITDLNNNNKTSILYCRFIRNRFEKKI